MRYIYCSSPYLADDYNYSLYLVLKALKTKSQKKVITKASKATRSRVVIAIKYSRTPAIDVLIEEQPITL